MEIDRQARGQHAEQLLEDPVFKAAQEQAAAETIEKWKLAKTVEEREACWAKHSAIGAVAEALNAFALDGKIAERETEKSRRNRK